MRYVNYTIIDGILLSVNILVNPLEFAQSSRREDLALEVGKEHPICQALHEIELAKHPMTYQFSPRNEMILCPGHNVWDV